MGLMEATQTSLRKSRRPSPQLMPKEKHKHNYNISGKGRTLQMNILHNSGFLQDVTDDKTLIEYFIEGINAGILQKIFGQNLLPTMIGKWYEATTKFDSQHRRLQEIISRKRGITGFQIQMKKSNTPRFSRSYQNNPNAMDIDRLTTKEREKHYKENRCFNCHKIGHQARDCRSPKQENQMNNEQYKGIKKTANAA